MEVLGHLVILGVSSKENSSVLTLGRGSGPRNLWEVSEGKKQKFTDWKGVVPTCLLDRALPSLYLEGKCSNLGGGENQVRNWKKTKHTHTHTFINLTVRKCDWQSWEQKHWVWSVQWSGEWWAWVSWVPDDHGDSPGSMGRAEHFLSKQQRKILWFGTFAAR